MTKLTIELDRVHHAVRDTTQNTWELLKKQPDGIYRQIEFWHGPRRTIFAHLPRHQIAPSRAAEERIAELPEAPAFPKEDQPVVS